MKAYSNFKNLFSAWMMLMLLSACAGTEKLKPGQLLYTGAEINIKNDTLSKKQRAALETGLEEQLTPKPNGSFLGMRPRVWIWNNTKEPTKDKGWTNFWKNKVGEKPVLLSDVDLEFNRSILQNYSENKGYFNAKASYDTVSKSKTAKVTQARNKDKTAGFVEQFLKKKITP